MPDEQSQVCKSITRGQRILIKGCITRGGGFVTRDNVMRHHRVQNTEVMLSCCYSVLNDPFSYIHCSRER